jgi:hypothetical protein
MDGSGFYYLHTNGELIYKRFRPDPSDFVRRIWEIEPSDRGNAWRILLEAAALGIRQDRLDELCRAWGITPVDLVEYFSRVGSKDSTKERFEGMKRIISSVWRYNPDELLDHISATPPGGRPDMSKYPWPNPR